MSGSARALLVYGVNLGNGHDLLTEDEVEDKVKPERVIWTKLAGSLPPERIPTRESGDDLAGAIAKYLGLEIEWHGSDDVEESLLLTIDVEADVYDGDTEIVHPDQMLIRAERAKYHERIVDALRTIGVDPDAYTIGWTIASYRISY